MELKNPSESLKAQTVIARTTLIRELKAGIIQKERIFVIRRIARSTPVCRLSEIG